MAAGAPLGSTLTIVLADGPTEIGEMAPSGKRALGVVVDRLHRSVHLALLAAGAIVASNARGTMFESNLVPLVTVLGVASSWATVRDHGQAVGPRRLAHLDLDKTYNEFITLGGAPAADSRGRSLGTVWRQPRDRT